MGCINGCMVKSNLVISLVPYKKCDSFLTGSGEREFEEFCILAARFLIEEDEEQMKKELKEAFRFYDKDGKKPSLNIQSCIRGLLEL